MKRSNRFLATGICVIFTLLASSSFAMDQVTITGTVYPVAWDENDKATQAVLMSEDQEYVIIKDGAGLELSGLEYMDVKVNGVLGTDMEGRATVTVTEYEVMLPEAEGATGNN